MSKPQTVAALALVSIIDRKVIVDTTGTKAAPGAKLENWEIYWGDGQENGDPGKPLINLDHEYDLSDNEEEYSITLIVKDNKNRAASAMIIVRIGPPIPPPIGLEILNESPLADTAVNDPVQIQFTAANGTPPLVWSVISGTLPPGILFSTDGEYYGDPTTDGIYTFRIRVQDSLGNSDEKDFSHTITAVVFPLQIVTANIAQANLNQFYSQTLVGSGGVPPYTWSVFSGTLPNGISLAGDTIQGTPTQSGNFNFQIRLQDSVGTQVFRSYTLVVNAPAALQILTNSLPNATQNQAYSAPLSATGGTTPYTWDIASGTLPQSLSIDGQVIDGNVIDDTGPYNFTIRVTDSVGAIQTKALSITVIAEGIFIITTPNVLPDGIVGNIYGLVIGTSGGTNPVTITKIAGNFPAASPVFNINQRREYRGTPTTAQTVNWTAQATDSSNPPKVTTKDFTHTIDPPSGVVIVGNNSYYDEMRALPECIAQYDLRSQALLNSLVPDPPAYIFSYINGNDPYSDPQDGAKFVDPGPMYIQQQLRMGFPKQFNANGGTLIISWDFWHGIEFRNNQGSVVSEKAYRVKFSPSGSTLYGIPKIYLKSEATGVGAGPLSIGLHNATLQISQGLPLPPGYTANDAVDPTGKDAYKSANRNPTSQNYCIQWGKYTRYWLLFEFNKPAAFFLEWEQTYNVTLDTTNDRRYTALSCWGWDEDRAIARLNYRMPLNPAGDGISGFDFEFDKGIGTLTGPLIGYGRNVFFLANYTSAALQSTQPENDTFLFRQPLS